VAGDADAPARPDQPTHEQRAQNVMQQEEPSIDDQVLAALQSPTLSGRPAVMNPKLISHHIGLTTGTG
jgi:hypothetical protein